MQNLQIDRLVGPGVTRSSREQEGGQMLKSRLANGSPPLQHFFKSCCVVLCCPAAMTWRWAPQTHYTLRCNTANIIKDLIL